MRLLLDSHVLVWSAEGNRRLGRRASSLISDPDSEIWISAASVWELAAKAASGRLRTNPPLDTWLPKTEARGFRPLAITHQHALASVALPRHHHDPFDRMLIAQAQIEDLRIVTADSQFDAYDVRVIDATA
ncbi:MAG TPA: type II toxin-antitoxin system VapC family toxin [Candidatus Binataceae bacterium]|nr:type II toxin-antitoxin system VapC family toxin [Candidatus Binataceae bacterium]